MGEKIMVKKKDYTKNITLGSVNDILGLALDKCCDIEEFAGVLVDNYIINDAEEIIIEDYEPRKYIVLREKYMNEWQSVTEMILTNDEKKVESFRRQHICWEV